VKNPVELARVRVLRIRLARRVAETPCGRVAHGAGKWDHRRAADGFL